MIEIGIAASNNIFLFSLVCRTVFLESREGAPINLPCGGGQRWTKDNKQHQLLFCTWLETLPPVLSGIIHVDGLVTLTWCSLL